MTWELSDYKKQELKELFKEGDVNFSILFLNINANLKGITIPKSNKVLANYSVETLDKISKKARELRLLINQLDDKQKHNIDYCIANQILENDSLVNTDKYYKKADSIEMFNRVERVVDFQRAFVKGRYGKGAWDQVVDAICHSWPIEKKIETNITLTSDLISFFSIILDEPSHEAILKRIKRSPWYSQHFELDTSWQDKL